MILGDVQVARDASGRGFSKRWALVVVILALFGAGYLVGTAWRGRAVETVGAWTEPYEPSPKFSDEHNAAMSWIVNEAAHSREPWTPEIAQRLAAIIDTGYTEEYIENVASRPGATLRDQEPAILYDYAQIAVAARLRNDEPMTLEAKRIATEALLGLLVHPHWRMRSSGIGSVISTGLVEIPAVRALIIAMFDDPNEVVAANARKHLTNYDEYGAAARQTK